MKIKIYLNRENATNQGDDDTQGESNDSLE